MPAKEVGCRKDPEGYFELEAMSGYAEKRVVETAAYFVGAGLQGLMYSS